MNARRPAGGVCEGPKSPFHAEAQRVYDAGKGLSVQHRNTALYWADNAGQSGTPVGHWLSIGSQMVDQLKLPLDRAAEMFVLMSVAQADAFIGCWHTKYEWNVLRPITYIRRHIDPDVGAVHRDASLPRVHLRPFDPVVGRGDGPHRAAGHGGVR